MTSRHGSTCCRPPRSCARAPTAARLLALGFAPITQSAATTQRHAWQKRKPRRRQRLSNGEAEHLAREQAQWLFVGDDPRKPNYKPPVILPRLVCTQTAKPVPANSVALTSSTATHSTKPAHGAGLFCSIDGALCMCDNVFDSRLHYFAAIGGDVADKKRSVSRCI